MQFGAPQFPVVPDEEAAKIGHRLKLAATAEAVILVTLLFTAQFWTIFQILTLLLVYFGIKDPLAYNPNFIVIFFTATVFGAVFAIVDALTQFSLLITGVHTDTSSPIPGVATGNVAVISGFGIAYAILAGVEVLACIFSWKLYKRLVSSSCRPAAVERSSSAVAASFQNLEPTTGFQPFQGQGSRLGS